MLMVLEYGPSLLDWEVSDIDTKSCKTQRALWLKIGWLFVVGRKKEDGSRGRGEVVYLSGDGRSSVGDKAGGTLLGGRY